MTFYARPGTTGSIVEIKTRYDNFIGGDWVKPLKGNYAEDLAPATGLAIAEYARSTIDDVDLAVAAGNAAYPGWEATSTTDRAATSSPATAARPTSRPCAATRKSRTSWSTTTRGRSASSSDPDASTHERSQP